RIVLDRDLNDQFLIHIFNVAIVRLIDANLRVVNSVTYFEAVPDETGNGETLSKSEE
ncbi:32009_t:CDS:2, partial [Gigaspora margarita]